MGIFQSKHTVYPSDEAYHHMIELATADIKNLIASIEESMMTLCVRPESVWYFTVHINDTIEKKLVVTSTIFLKLFKRFCVRDYTMSVDGENTIIQFVHEGKTV